MSNTNDERLLDLRALVRERFGRDLRLIASISDAQQQLSLRDLLDELHYVYIHYLELNALLNNAQATIAGSTTKLQEELNRLRSIDS